MARKKYLKIGANKLTSFEVQLKKSFKHFNLPENPQAWSKLECYLVLLQKWNKVYNLTSIRDPQEMFIKHLLDSLAIAPYVENGKNNNQRLIDVGTGGGLPGIPLAILYPEKQIDLLDSNSKKTRFLIQAKTELGLKNTLVLHQRVEDYQPAEKYDGVVSRAFSSLNDMLSLTQHLVAPSGCWWAMKAQKTQEEIESLPGYAKLKNIFSLNVPGLNAERSLIQLEMIKERS